MLTGILFEQFPLGQDAGKLTGPFISAPSLPDSSFKVLFAVAEEVIYNFQVKCVQILNNQEETHAFIK